MYKLYIIILCCLVNYQPLHAQVINDSATYKKLLSNALYNYDELGDSLLDYAAAFDRYALQNNFPEAFIQANKLIGVYHEVNGSFDSALIYYQKAENLAHQQNNREAVIAGLFDRMSVYLSLQQYEQGKKILHEALYESRDIGNKKLMSAAWSNLGIIYRRTGQLDSAYFAYRQSMQLKLDLNDVVGLANTRTNFASLLILNNEYKEALKLLDENIKFYKTENRNGELCYSFINAADAWRGLKNIPKAQLYIDSAMQLVKTFDMQQRLPTILSLQAAMAYQKGDYKTAFELKDSVTKLDNKRINDETRQQITELNTKYKVKQKEQQNILLTTRITNQQLEQRNILIVGFAMAAIAIIALFAWFNSKKKNAILQQQHNVIAKQNQQLTQLNADKNNLISMVSHDLSQPFIQLKLWATIIEKKLKNQSITDLEDPIAKMKDSIQYGEQLIHNMLDVEKAGANQHHLKLETLDLQKMLEDMALDFAPAATGKNITLLTDVPEKLMLQTDKQHLRQVLENLVSNALKFCYSDGQVQLKAYTKPGGNIVIEVHDNGPGLSEDEMEIIFNKYAVAQTRPTAGERSTGLGLSIVKRLMLELGGTIEVESKKGQGICFRLAFVSQANT